MTTPGSGDQGAMADRHLGRQVDDGVSALIGRDQAGEVQHVAAHGGGAQALDESGARSTAGDHDDVVSRLEKSGNCCSSDDSGAARQDCPHARHTPITNE
jgi:hypothetical protein